ncbi:hypothetical protein BpHYR1_052611, partial [Brachionus plicatilis]
LLINIVLDTNWTCSNCTYQNPYNTSHCGICNRERQLNEFILCKYCSHKNSLSSLSCMSCTSQLLDINNEESQRTRQSSNSSSCSSVRVNSVQSNVQNGNTRLPVYAQCQANYTSQSSSSSNLSVFLDNPVYFNLSSSNLNEMGDARIPPRSPQVLSGQFQDPLQQRPSIPVILDDHSKLLFYLVQNCTNLYEKIPSSAKTLQFIAKINKNIMIKKESDKNMTSDNKI